MDVAKLKSRIFWNKDDEVVEDNLDPSLEEIMEMLVKEGHKAEILEERGDDGQADENTWLLAEEQLFRDKVPEVILYSIEKNVYQIYTRKKSTTGADWEQNVGDIYVPVGVTVERVQQNVLGIGVLGRAFIYQNHIQILDRLIGPEYFEVLTHEVFHIMYPEKNEVSIRMMTRNYVGDSARYH
jgi:hypothetical protein